MNEGTMAHKNPHFRKRQHTTSEEYLQQIVRKCAFVLALWGMWVGLCPCGCYLIRTFAECVTKGVFLRIYVFAKF